MAQARASAARGKAQPKPEEASHAEEEARQNGSTDMEESVLQQEDAPRLPSEEMGVGPLAC